MHASQLPLPHVVEPPEGVGPGDRALIGSGLAVALGPGLVAGGALLQRVFGRLEAALTSAFEGLGAHAASLPASEGEALLNLALHAGPLAPGRPRTLHALGTGFREDVRAEHGLAGLALYRRFDVVRLDVAGADPAAALLDTLRRALASLGTRCGELRTGGDDHTRTGGEPRTGGDADTRTADADAPAARTPAADTPRDLDLDLAWGARDVGRVFERRLGDGDDAPRAALLGLDLHALLAAVADVQLDAEGLLWPAALAPFDLGILPGAADDAGSRARAIKLHDALERAGLAVLLDDREQRPADARRALRAWGLPAAALFGPGLPPDQVLLELRDGGPPAPVPEAELLARLGHTAKSGGRRGSSAARANY